MTLSSALPAHGNPAFARLPEYRAVLEEQWRQQVAHIIELSYAALSPAPGESDDASPTSPLRLAARLIAAAQQELQETEAALARVDDGSYGLCGRCRAPITSARLEIVPAARYCVACEASHLTRR